jgi:hypothetical protein
MFLDYLHILEGWLILAHGPYFRNLLFVFISYDCFIIRDYYYYLNEINLKKMLYVK